MKHHTNRSLLSPLRRILAFAAGCGLILAALANTLKAQGFPTSDRWDYETYTWHTNLDTFDKISVDDLRFNATLVAMLAYAASEDPQLLARATRELPMDARAGKPREWPRCAPARRASSGR